jgi:hypothetical protein
MKNLYRSLNIIISFSLAERNILYPAAEEEEESKKSLLLLSGDLYNNFIDSIKSKASKEHYIFCFKKHIR